MLTKFETQSHRVKGEGAIGRWIERKQAVVPMFGVSCDAVTVRVAARHLRLIDGVVHVLQSDVYWRRNRKCLYCRRFSQAHLLFY